MHRAVTHRRSGRGAVITLIVLLALLITGQSASSHASPPRGAALTTRFAQGVLTVLNDERRAHHLAPLHLNPDLIRSAHRHNLAMARANTMSHQLPREPYFATRMTQAGYHWSWAGENIGWNSEQTLQGALYLERIMYVEKPPNDGHRLNILNKHYTDIGVDIYYDAQHHKIWLTEDFGRPL
jgi:uncharacterized protein YkwD